MFFVDTNVFLEPLLGQERGLEVEAFFRRSVIENVPLACTGFSIHAVEAILSGKKMLTVLERFLLHIKEMHNLTIINTTLDDEFETIKQMQETKLDFDDALQYLVARQTNCKAIISFDKHFDKTDLLRKEPREFL